MNDAIRQNVADLVFSSLDDAIWSAKRSRARREHPFIEAAFPGAGVITSVVRSASTRLGQKIMTEAAKDIARGAGRHVLSETQIEVPLTESEESTLREIHTRLRRNRRAPNFEAEIEELKEAGQADSQSGDEPVHHQTLRCDLRMEATQGQNYWIQLTSPKMSQRKVEQLHKEALLLHLAKPHEQFVVGVYYAVGRSGRHRRSGLNYVSRYFQDVNEFDSLYLEAGEQIVMNSAPCVLIGAPFWNWLGKDETTYDELLEIFRDAGEELRMEHRELLGGNSTE